MLGHTQDVVTAVRIHLPEQIDLRTHRFTESQRAVTLAVVGASVADLIWRSITDPTEEKRWELPKVAQEVADVIVNSAANAALNIKSESDFTSFMASSNLRRIAAETKIEVTNLLERRARGH